MKIQHLMALVVLSLLTVPGARAAVLAGPLTNAANGHTYYLLSANTWTASEAEARGLGGHLVTINDAAENQWVLNTFFPLTGVPYASLWIGLNDAANEGQFVWASGEPVTFTYWYPGEPNNLGGEDYATIRHPSESQPTGSWNDLSDTSGQQNPNAPTFGVVELTVAVTQLADQFMPDGSARLNGQANPRGSPTLAWFEWGTSRTYGNATPPQSVGSGNNFVGFSNVLVGLISGTEYHFRTRASNGFGFFAGADQTFNLGNQRPVVTTLAANQLSSTSARLKGQVNPRGSPTVAWFEWGTDTNYGNLIGMQHVGQGSIVSNLSVVLDGLMSGPIYHYRLVATNAFGAVYGADQTINLGIVPANITWTGADPSGYWSAPANWFPTGVPTNGADLVFPGGLPPEDMVSTNDLTDSIFRSIKFVQAGGHTIRGNPITLTNPTSAIIHDGTNVIACDLTFSGTGSIRGSSFGELTVIGNVGGGRLGVGIGAGRVVIRGQFTGGSLFVDWYSTLALYGDNPHPVSADVWASKLLVQGSLPNLDIRLGFSIKTLTSGSLSGDGVVGDVTGDGGITPDSTLSVKNVSVGSLFINLNGTNVGEYGRLVASGDVSLGSGRLFPSAGFNPQAGQVFTIVEKTSPGPIANAFLGPEGTVTTLNGMPFRISYVGGDGNDVTLTAQPSNADPTFSDANWSALGGFPGVNDSVLAAVVDDSGNLYIGGGFTRVGDVPANRIAKWNGTNWSALGSGVEGSFGLHFPTAVNALAVSGGDLYAGGHFTRAGGSPAISIAKWNGSSWSPLGSGVGGDAVVLALAVSGSDLYAGGSFWTAGGSPATNIAKWNGSSWSPLGSGTGAPSEPVLALAVSGSDLYAGGRFTTAGGSPANRIAKWDGNSWSVLGSGMDGLVSALAVSGSELYAGGEFTTGIAKWNGSSWSAVGSGMNGSVFELAVSGTDLYAGGSFTAGGGSPANRIAKWDGNSWSALGSGMDNHVGTLAVSGNDLYAGGSFTMAGGKVSPYIAKARIGSVATSITASGSSVTIQFSGVVGYEYHVQRTDSLTPPMTWTTLTTTPLSPAADGSLTFTDTNAPPGTAYYWLVQHVSL